MRGNEETEKYMTEVDRAIFKHFELGDSAAVEIHNRAYEAIEKATKELRAALMEASADLLGNHARQIKVCHWTEDMDGIWTRSCSETPWEFGSPGTTPSENGMRVCLECGGELIEHEYDCGREEAR